MNVFKILTSNYILNVGVTAWFFAQVLKTLFTLLFTKRLVFERLVGAGGMPSSHSALASSIAIAMVNKVGFSSPEFGLAFAFAVVVMYDAMGVRRAAGEQAKVLNRIVFEFENFPSLFRYQLKHGPDAAETHEEEENEPLTTRELKEFLGHTPLEVLGGCLLGILVALYMPVV